MSPRVAALWAIPFAIVGFLLRIAARWVSFDEVFDSFPAGLLADLLVFVLSVGLPLGGYHLLTRPARLEPATWVLDPARSRFVARSAPRPAGFPLILIGLWAATALPTERVPHESHRQFAAFSTLNTIAFTAVGLVFLVIFFSVLAGRPWVAVDRDGVIRQDLRQDRVAWGELTPEQPEWWSWLWVRGLAVGKLKLPVTSLHIDQTLLAFTIRNYKRVPGLREQIGTAEGLEVLQSAYQKTIARR
ncbi:hypothetical protein [Actinoplanes awajinensis]|uniref:Uncharacterized protein n=1 Tax=Actinoplanes awajinensis subsp. mycoplanecinus TaxID=135947 RepID=A0A101JQ24_9ACTN|nr:hypothetical protein [Actinoplanes awajinensis]KUL30931.1 hypothetical protein ADL15_23555 [Actinoplanes awajinensis subsp. mycoplanecinus]